LLTGADFDIESVRKDQRGNFWFGDELGPFLLEADRNGKVLDVEVALPNVPPPGSTSSGPWVMSPQNPYLGADAPNLGGSRGFEGMAINPAGTKLYPLLEGTVTGDDARPSVANRRRLRPLRRRSRATLRCGNAALSVALLRE
jgi:hypothetical protein